MGVVVPEDVGLVVTLPLGGTVLPLPVGGQMSTQIFMTSLTESPSTLDAAQLSSRSTPRSTKKRPMKL